MGTSYQSLSTDFCVSIELALAIAHRALCVKGNENKHQYFACQCGSGYLGNNEYSFNVSINNPTCHYSLHKDHKVISICTVMTYARANQRNLIGGYFQAISWQALHFILNHSLSNSGFCHCGCCRCSYNYDPRIVNKDRKCLVSYGFNREFYEDYVRGNLPAQSFEEDVFVDSLVNEPGFLQKHEYNKQPYFTSDQLYPSQKS